MLKVGQTEQVEITGYSSEGEGVCRIDGCAVFVPNAIRGERCTVKITHVSRNSAHGKIQQLLLRSPHRIPRACPEAKLCGGCQLHHMDYAEELAFKAQKVTDALNRIGGQSLETVPVTGAGGMRTQNAKCEMQKEATGAGAVSQGISSGCQIEDLGRHLIGRPDEATGNTLKGTGRQQATGDEGTDCHDQSADWSRNDNSVGAVIGRPDEATGNTLKDTGRQQATGDEGTDCHDQSADWSRNDNSVGAVVGRPQEASVQSSAGTGAIDDPSVPVPPAAWGYRNKAQYPAALKNGVPAAGFYKNRTHEVIPVQRCAILPEVFDRVRDVVIRWAREDRVSVYDEHTGRGLLRHIYVRRGAVSGQVMVCLVVNGRGLPRENRLVHALQREIPGLASVQISVNTKNTNVVLGDEFRTLWGRDWIEDTLCGFSFRLSPRSFYQVNHDQAQRLYEKALEFAALHGTETVLDLYCGTGTITLALSRQAGRVVGVEVVPQAIEDARQNALRNAVKNVEFLCADAKIAAERFASKAFPLRGRCPSAHTGADEVASRQPSADEDAAEKDGFLTTFEMTGPDVILVDPPRKGLAPEVIDAMVTMAPERIVYVSCDPATLARDVKRLNEKGYVLTRAEAFDLFPRTFHVETVCLLSKLRTEQKVEIDLDLSELDLTAAESAATYEEIKGYVQEHFGFQVSSLQIAQTKRSLEIPMGRNYNPSKKEIHHIPQCPPEKAAAIRTALEHFQML